MAGFGLGAMNGFINTYSGLKRLDQRDRQLDQADKRMAREQQRLDANMELRKKAEERQAYNFQRQKDLQNMNILTSALANGQDIGEEGWKLYQDTQTRMPMFSELGRKSGAMDAALKVLNHAGPESANDPATISALSSVLTMGADPAFIQKIDFDPSNPGAIVATGKDGVSKEYNLADLEKHASYVSQMRDISKSPEFLKAIGKMRQAYGFDKKATGVFKEIYNDLGQKQLARIDPSTGKVLNYVGGAKKEKPVAKEPKKEKLYKVTDAEGNERWVTREQALAGGGANQSQLWGDSLSLAEKEADDKASLFHLDSTDFPEGKQRWINNRALELYRSRGGQGFGLSGEQSVSGQAPTTGAQQPTQPPQQTSEEELNKIRSLWGGGKSQPKKTPQPKPIAKEKPFTLDQKYMDAAKRMKKSALMDMYPETGLWAGIKRANEQSKIERLAPTTQELAKILPPLIERAKTGDPEAKNELKGMALKLPDDVLAKLLQFGVIE